MANVQVALGISTLLYLVPVSLAGAHEAGSVGLLTAAIHVLLAGTGVTTSELGLKGDRSADNGGEKLAYIFVVQT
jgi:heme A synthase